MEIKNLLAQPENQKIQIAKMRNVYHEHEVEQKLSKLRENANDDLRMTYKHMLERGGERFHVKLSGIPDMTSMYEELPNFEEVLDDVSRNVSLCEDSSDGLEITPILLLGPPGIGKTYFSQKLGELLGTSMSLVSMSSTTTGWVLSGSASKWQHSGPGKIFETLVHGQYANPVIVVDEIDKASNFAQYDPLGALYGLLEHDTAKVFTDEFAEIPIDASQVIWVTTANDERLIPEPILNRMNVFEIEKPTQEQARKVALNLYKSIRSHHDWGKYFEEKPCDKVLDALTEVAPREMRRVLISGFGSAKMHKRSTIQVEDLPVKKHKKTSIGFITPKA